MPTQRAVLRDAPAMRRPAIRRVSGNMPTDYSYIARAADRKWGAIASAVNKSVNIYADAVVKADIQAAKAASQEYQNALAGEWYGQNVLNGKTYDPETNTYPYLELEDKYKTDSEDIAERILDKYQLRTQAGKNQFGLYRTGIDGRVNEEIGKFVLDKENERAGDAIKQRLENANSVEVVDEIYQDLIDSGRSTPEAAALQVDPYRTNIEFKSTRDSILKTESLGDIAKHLEIVKENALYSQTQIEALERVALRKSTAVLAAAVGELEIQTYAQAIEHEEQLNNMPIDGTVFTSEAEYQAAVDTAMSQTYDRLRKEKASRDMSASAAITAQNEKFVATQNLYASKYLTGEEYDSLDAIQQDIEKARLELDQETGLFPAERIQILNYLGQNLRSEYAARASAQTEEELRQAELESLQRIAQNNWYPSDIPVANDLYEKSLASQGIDIRTPEGLVAGLQIGKQLMKGGGGWVPDLLTLEIKRLINNPREDKLEDIATAVSAVQFLGLRAPPQGLSEFDAFVKENSYDTATTADLWLRHTDAMAKNWTKQATTFLDDDNNKKKFRESIEQQINKFYGIDLDDYYVAESVFAQAEELYKQGFKGNHETAVRMVSNNLGKVWGYVATGESDGPQMMYMSPYAVHSNIPFPSTENMWIEVHKREVLDEIFDRTGQRFEPNKVGFELAEYHPTDPTYRLVYEGNPIAINIRSEQDVLTAAEAEGDIVVEASKPSQLVYAEIKFGKAESKLRKSMGEAAAANEGKESFDMLVSEYGGPLGKWKKLSLSDDIMTPAATTTQKELVYVNEMKMFEEVAKAYINDPNHPNKEVAIKEMDIQRGNYHFWLLQNGRIAPDAP